MCGSEEFTVTNSTTFYCTRFTVGNVEVAINRPRTHNQQAESIRLHSRLSGQVTFGSIVEKRPMHSPTADRHAGQQVRLAIRLAVPSRDRDSQLGLFGVVTGNSYPLFSGKQSVDSVSFLNLTGSLTMTRRGCVQSSAR
jgi:hypothetical protein